MTAPERLIDYKSKHGFPIKYPFNWKLVSVIDESSDTGDAEKRGTNYFQFYNYNYNKDSDTWPENIIKIETSVYRNIDHAGKELGELVESCEAIGKETKAEKIIINGKTAWKVREELELDGESAFLEKITICYRVGNKFAIFNCYCVEVAPEIDRIIKTFSFTK